MSAVYLSPEDLKVIQDALECACTARLHAFDKAEQSRDVASRQRAIRAARDVKRFSKVLSRINYSLSA